MTTHTRRRAGLISGACVAAGFLVLAAAGPALTATNSAPTTTIRKSVQTLMDPDGTVQATRVYTQIQSTGAGQVSFTDSTSGSLRNLNGFGIPPVSGSKATFDFNVDGLMNQRTLQDYVKTDLPIKVKVDATLDGQPVSANDLVGKSGLLKMTYTITNDTAVDQEITWKDGNGATQSKTVPVPIPYVGSFTTVLSDAYANIVAPGASMGGTGRNSTQLSYNLLLYKPLGDTTATVTYEANITNADIPGVDMTFLPAGPAENPSTKSLQDQIKGGAETGVQLTGAGSKIDENLLKLAAGAGKLNEGLAQLYSGSQTLSSGLNDTAVPGANKLAIGAKQLATGLNNTAVPGAKKLAAGSAQVAAGMKQLKAGLADLPATVADNPDFATLMDGFDAVIAGLGSPSDSPSAGTVMGGLNGIGGGLAQVSGGLDNPAINFPASTGPCDSSKLPGTTGYCGILDALQLLSFGLSNPACVLTNPTNPANPCGAVQVVDAVQSSLAAASATGGSLDQLLGAAKGVYQQIPCPAAAPNPAIPIAGIYPPTTLVGPPFNLAGTSPCVLQSNVIYGLGLPAGIPTATAPGGVKAQSATAAGALAQVSTGLTGSAIPGINKMKAGIGAPATAGTLLNGIAQMTAGVGQLKTGVYHPCAPSDPTFPATCGISQVTRLLQGGVVSLVDSIGSTLSGNPDLAKLVEGSAQVAGGNATLASGLVTAANGSTRVADGANQIATGLAPAASGAAQIAQGLGQAVPGGTQIEDGANQLSEKGSKALIAKGNETANSYGEQYALMQALNTRSATQAGIPNGPATGKDVATTGAFGYTLQAVAQTDSANALRFLLAGLLLAGAVGMGVAFGRN